MPASCRLVPLLAGPHPHPFIAIACLCACDSRCSSVSLVPPPIHPSSSPSPAPPPLQEFDGGKDGGQTYKKYSAKNTPLMQKGKDTYGFELYEQRYGLDRDDKVGRRLKYRSRPPRAGGRGVPATVASTDPGRVGICFAGEWTGGAPGDRGPTYPRKHSEAGGRRLECGGEWAAKTNKRPPQQPAQLPVRQLLGSADAETTPQGTTAAAAVRTQRPDAKGRTGDCPGPAKKLQPDGMSHGGEGGGLHVAGHCPRSWDHVSLGFWWRGHFLSVVHYIRRREISAKVNQTGSPGRRWWVRGPHVSAATSHCTPPAAVGPPPSPGVVTPRPNEGQASAAAPYKRSPGTIAP